MSRYKEHALREFEYAGWMKNGKFEDDMQEMICNQVLELLELFADHEHSGSSAPYAINLFSTLAKFEPIGTIKCTEEEWVEVGPDKFQNKRLSSVFKNGEDGKPYYLDAIIWKKESGCCYTGVVEGIHSSQFIKLPFSPKKFCIDLTDDGKIKDVSQLKAVDKYYDLRWGWEKNNDE